MVTARKIQVELAAPLQAAVVFAGIGDPIQWLLVLARLAAAQSGFARHQNS